MSWVPLSDLSGVVEKQAEIANAIREKISSFSRPWVLSKRVDAWLSEVEKEHPYLFSEHDCVIYRNFLKTVLLSETIRGPTAVVRAVKERGIKARDAFIEDLEIGLIIRHKILQSFINCKNSEFRDLANMCALHFFLCHTELSDYVRIPSGVTADSFYIENIRQFGALVNFGISAPASFDRVVINLSDIAEKKHSRFCRLTSNEDGYDDCQLRQQFNGLMREYKQRLMGTVTGVKSEVLAYFLLKQIFGTDNGSFEIRHSSIDLDKKGIGDLVVVEPVSEKILLLVDVKAEDRSGLGYLFLGKKSGKPLGTLDLRKAQPLSAVEYNKTEGIPILALRIPHSYIYQDLKEFLGSKSPECLAGNLCQYLQLKEEIIKNG